MKKHTILVVDTKQDVARDLSRVLNEEGFCTLTATSANEALEKLQGNFVDLIISNYAMREFSANELLKKVEKPYSPRIRIILTDQKEVHEKQSAGNENEIYWFVTNPWEKEDLFLTVKNALKYADLLSKDNALLETIGVLAARDLSLEDKLQKILKISLRQINAERGSIMLRDKQGDLVVKAASKQRLLGEKRCIEDENSVSVWVLRNGKSLFVEKCKEDSRFKPSEEALYKTDNFLCVPIKNERNAVIGIFNVTDKIGGGVITREDESILSEFISRIVILIENAQLKEELEEERRRLKVKNEELIALEEMRENLVNMIVHDLKAPLGEIMANLDLLSYAQLESQDKECLDSATQGSENLLRMILNLLDVRRMEEGRLKLHCEEFDVGSIIEEVVKKYKTTIKQKEIEVKTVIDEEVSAWTADRSLIERVLINLLSNAIRYSHRGGEVEIVSEYHQGEQLKIEVKDNGEGIPKKFQREIFEKFSQLDSGHSMRKNSTGLGLTFCKLAVETHQGKIWVESEEGRGSRFIFLLPLKKASDLTWEE
jgi:two-component system sensor histidine kinase KdpD